MVRPNVQILEQVLQDQGHDSEELVALLEISPEDIYQRFKDKIWEHRERIYYETLPSTTGEENEEDDELDEAIEDWKE